MLPRSDLCPHQPCMIAKAHSAEQGLPSASVTCEIQALLLSASRTWAQ